MRDLLSVTNQFLYYKYNLRSRNHLNYAMLHTGKGVQFPAHGFSPDLRPLSGAL